MLSARHLLHGPRLLVLCHSMENRQELAHASRQRDLCRVAGPAPALRKPCEDWMVPDRAQRAPRQGRPDMSAPTPGRAGPPPGPAVPMAGGTTAEGCHALAASGAQRRQGKD
jgi:hypothetical protein